MKFWTITNMFILAAFIIFVVKVLSPRVTWRNMFRMFFKVLYWPIRALSKVIRKEYNTAKADTIPEEQKVTRRKARNRIKGSES